MKTITLQTAVALAINDLKSVGPFSAYDVTRQIRAKVDDEYEIEDADYDDEEGFPEISHANVRKIVVELFENGLIDCTKAYGSNQGHRFVLYTPLDVQKNPVLTQQDIADSTKISQSVPVVSITQSSKPDCTIPPMPQPPITNSPVVDRIKSYIEEKQTTTPKQIQSTLKIKGFLCKDILNLLNIPDGGSPASKVLIQSSAI
jgi:transcription initiation factor IIE alpha subunit